MQHINFLIGNRFGFIILSSAVSTAVYPNSCIYVSNCSFAYERTAVIECYIILMFLLSSPECFSALRKSKYWLHFACIFSPGHMLMMISVSTLQWCPLAWNSNVSLLSSIQLVLVCACKLVIYVTSLLWIYIAYR